ncbi:hypothetical protein JX265_000549 [Neoarthrinium moseri]|uniref:CFEM domain-containing protein n=1 Tax=Neoarthrinium moseri TaxID=1658444 RepID=A0A9P9WYQ3_9PEZI|nr:hypothetical protein JX265_000549 [Neoarthrinium moseri]
MNGSVALVWCLMAVAARAAVGNLDCGRTCLSGAITSFPFCAVDQLDCQCGPKEDDIGARAGNCIDAQCGPSPVQLRDQVLSSFSAVCSSFHRRKTSSRAASPVPTQARTTFITTVVVTDGSTGHAETKTVTETVGLEPPLTDSVTSSVLSPATPFTDTYTGLTTTSPAQPSQPAGTGENGTPGLAKKYQIIIGTMVPVSVIVTTYLVYRLHIRLRISSSRDRSDPRVDGVNQTTQTEGPSWPVGTSCFGRGLGSGAPSRVRETHNLRPSRGSEGVEYRDTYSERRLTVHAIRH